MTTLIASRDAACLRKMAANASTTAATAQRALALTSDPVARGLLAELIAAQQATASAAGRLADRIDPPATGGIQP
jgi:hypothetical protein